MKKLSKFHLHDGVSGSAITVHVIHNCPRSAVGKISEEGIITILLASPVKNQDVNQALLAFLASILKVKVTQLEIVGGQNLDDKLIAIANLDSATAEARLLSSIQA